MSVTAEVVYFTPIAYPDASLMWVKYAVAKWRLINHIYFMSICLNWTGWWCPGRYTNSGYSWACLHFFFGPIKSKIKFICKSNV